jgi:hypothetical protein
MSFIQDLAHYPVLVLVLAGIVVAQWKLFMTLAVTLLAGVAIVGVLTITVH